MTSGFWATISSGGRQALDWGFLRQVPLRPMALSGLAVDKLKHQPSDPLLLVDLMSTALIGLQKRCQGQLYPSLQNGLLP